jgi:hypothetical protein
MAILNPQTLSQLIHPTLGSLPYPLPSFAAPSLRPSYPLSILWGQRSFEVQMENKGVYPHPSIQLRMDRKPQKAGWSVYFWRALSIWGGPLGPRMEAESKAQ